MLIEEIQAFFSTTQHIFALYIVVPAMGYVVGKAIWDWLNEKLKKSRSTADEA